MALFTKPQFNTVWASTGAKLAPEVAKINQGWVVEIPPHEFDNWMQNRQDALLAHLNQLGIPQWDSTVEYQAGKSYVQGTNTGVVYRAITTHTNVNPEIDIQNNWTIAFESSGSALLKANNLSDVPDKAQARINLGIATTEFYDTRYLLKGSNLVDVPNKATARTNLGLGNSAVLNVGTLASTVAAGDDSRIVNAVQTTRQVVSGSGLIGGGDLSSDRILSLGTPSTITRTSSNNVSLTSHSHSVDVDSLFPSTQQPNGSIKVGPVVFQWGSFDLPNVGNEATGIVSFPDPFPSNCFQIFCSSDAGRVGGEAIYEGFRLTKIDRSTFRWTSSWEFRQAGPVVWFAIGN